MAVGAPPSKDLSYLYERLLYKLTDEGFHNGLSIGGFLVIFIFCTVALALILVVVVSWCSQLCFQGPTRSNKVGVMVTPASGEKAAVAEHKPMKTKKKKRNFRVGAFGVKRKTYLYMRPKVMPAQKPTVSTAAH